MDTPILTASLAITPQMLSLIAEIDEFKGAWRALGMLALGRVPVGEGGRKSHRLRRHKSKPTKIE